MVSSALVSEPMVWIVLLSVSGLLIGAVEDEESEERNGASMVGEVGRGVMSVESNTAGMASEMLGDKGPISCLSLIEQTIFSKPNEVMCFSFPRDAAMVVGGFRFECVWISNGAVGEDGDDGDSSVASDSSDDTESTLAESSGTSLRPGLDVLMSIAGVVANCGCVSQQRVSRFHIRQLRFSNRLPFSIDSAHFEKTGANVNSGP